MARIHAASEKPVCILTASQPEKSHQLNRCIGDPIMIKFDVVKLHVCTSCQIMLSHQRAVNYSR